MSTHVPQPLDSEEIKSAIVTKVAEQLWDSLNRTCNLYGVAYPRFKASGEILLVLDNFGEEIKDLIRFELPYTPPDKLRKETGQEIPRAGLPEKAPDGSAVFTQTERKLGRAASSYDD